MHSCTYVLDTIMQQLDSYNYHHWLTCLSCSCSSMSCLFCLFTFSLSCCTTFSVSCCSAFKSTREDWKYQPPTNITASPRHNTDNNKLTLILLLVAVIVDQLCSCQYRNTAKSYYMNLWIVQASLQFMYVHIRTYGAFCKDS